MAVNWEDEAIVLSLNMFGEAKLRVALLTKTRGLFVAMLRGGRKTNVGVIPGVTVTARWRARLIDQMGTAELAIKHNPTINFWNNAMALDTAAAALTTAKILPERLPYPNLFESLQLFLQKLSDNPTAVAMLVCWELNWLKNMGFELDLATCAVHNERSYELLRYASPRTGRAVCETGAGIWKDKMQHIPKFLRGCEENKYNQYSEKLSVIPINDIIDGLEFTGWYIRKAVREMEGRQQWELGARSRLLNSLYSSTRLK